ncbi:MAG: pseudouridine synthase [Oscillospiraceae bacterium]|nr:pseudouridine synthase [Oscillospiraceae bacterium]
MTIRLDKFLSTQTSFTRSEIKKLLLKNKVLLNGKPIRDGSLKIDTAASEIVLDGKKIAYREKVYMILNKPQGYVCATEDKKEKTVLELIDEKDRRKDTFPAGRLDKDTVGMVLITNDGELSHKILSPRNHIPKYYIVKLAETFKNEYIQKFKQGIEIDGGEVCLPAVAKAFEADENTALLEICEGKFHQVKRMFEAVENKVVKLQRIQMGSLEIPVKLGVGEYMEIMHKDVEKLLKQPCFEVVYSHIVQNFSSYWINKQSEVCENNDLNRC